MPRAHVRLISEVHFPHETTLSRLGEMTALSNAQKTIQRVNKTEKTETKEYVSKQINK